MKTAVPAPSPGLPAPARRRRRRGLPVSVVARRARGRDRAGGRPRALDRARRSDRHRRATTSPIAELPPAFMAEGDAALPARHRQPGPRPPLGDPLRRAGVDRHRRRRRARRGVARRRSSACSPAISAAGWMPLIMRIGDVILSLPDDPARPARQRHRPRGVPDAGTARNGRRSILIGAIADA